MTARPVAATRVRWDGVTLNGERLFLAALLLLLVCGRGPAAQAACNTNICTPVGADPCTIGSGTYNIDDGCVLNFGNRTVTVGGAATVQSVLNDGGTITIIAGNLTVRGLVKAAGGFIEAQVANAFRTESNSGNDGRVNVSGGTGNGEIDVTAGGSITLANQSFVRANDGGTVDMCVGTRAADFTCFPGTGGISITNNPADGNAGLSVTGTAATGAGTLTIIGGAVTIGASAVLDANNPANDDSGGSIAITARGPLTMAGLVRANGSGNNGSGGDLTLEAVGNNSVTVSGTARAEGGSTGPDRTDGSVDLSGCTVSVTGMVDTEGSAADGINSVEYRQSFSVSGAGCLRAGVNGENDVSCRAVGGNCVTAPSIVCAVPASDLFPDATIGPCDGCGDGELDPGEACDDGNLIQCDGCSTLCNGNTCNDGSVCTTNDFCSGSVCTGTPVNCDDGNVCTTELGCNPVTGCVRVNNTNPCASDGNACTTDVCSGGICTHPAVSCDDGNVCTTDSCNPSTGACSHTNNTSQCASDGNACTTDVCSGGVCTHPMTVNCDDNNVCTTDSCNPSTGCVHTNNTGPCASDGNACTADVCSGGTCTHPALNCDDNNVCTTDSCNQSTGCTHTNVTSACNDGNACTAGDVCYLGQCIGPQVTNCDDQNPCTQDTCSPASGCAHTLQACNYQLALTFRSPDPVFGDQFGYSVAALGNNIVVGALNDSISGTNAGGVFLFSGTTGQLIRSFNEPGPQSGDWFGVSVAAVGSDRIVVGTQKKDAGFTDAGAAYLFDANTGALLQTFTNPTTSIWFGAGVGGFGSNVLVGSPVSLTAHLFDSGTGALVRTFMSLPPGTGDFGRSVAAMGSNVLVGAQGAQSGGAVWLFNGSTGAIIRAFVKPSPAPFDSLGYSMTPVVGQDVLAGAYGDDTAGTDAGAAYLFNGATGVLKRTFVSPSPDSQLSFGLAVAAVGSAALIGEVPHLTSAARLPGAVYLFDSATGTLMQSFQNPTPSTTLDYFGRAVAPRGHDILIGAVYSDASGGAVYLYRKRCGNGVVDSGEQCDDGNAVDGDCCSSTCQFEPMGAPCEIGNPCTMDVCNGAGVCEPGACLAGIGCGSVCGTNLFCQVDGENCVCR